MLFFSCAIIGSNVKHSEWIQIKSERSTIRDSTQIEMRCEVTNYNNKIRFTEKFDIYCYEMKNSIHLYSKYFLDAGIHNLLIKVEVLPFESPSRWLPTPYSVMIFPSSDNNAKVMVTWYKLNNRKGERSFLHTKELSFNRYMFFWLFIGFGQYDLVKRIYEDRWYEGESFGLNLTGFHFPSEFAIILNRRMIQDVIDGKVSLVSDSSK